MRAPNPTANVSALVLLLIACGSRGGSGTDTNLARGGERRVSAPVTTGSAYVAASAAVDSSAVDVVSVIDIASRKVLKTIPMKLKGQTTSLGTPSQVSVRPDGAFVYATISGARLVAVIDAKLGEVVGSIQIPRAGPLRGDDIPIGIAVNDSFGFVGNP